MSHLIKKVQLSAVQNVFNNCGYLSLISNAQLVHNRKYSVHNDRPSSARLLNAKSVTENHVRTNSSSSNITIKSPMGNSKKIPNENILEHIFKDIDDFIEQPAATCAASGRSYSYGMLRMLINRCAQAMIGHCGMKPREVVGLLLPNIPEYPIVCFGAIEAGLTVTFVNPLYTPDEVKRQFENAGVKMIITVPLLLEVATTIAPQLQDYRTTICVGGDDDPAQNVHGLESLLRAGHEGDVPGLNPRELCLLPYSSGTTGLPKGVMLSHHNLVSNLVQLDHPAMVDPIREDGSYHKCLTVLPFFHIYGFNAILNVCLKFKMHLLTIPRFTPEDYIKALVEHKPTTLFVVPSLILFLATHPAVKQEHLATVTHIQSGAAPLTEAQIHAFKKKVQRDVHIRQGYGMTESAPVTFLVPHPTPPSKIGTIGIPIPGTEAKIIDLNTGEPLPTHKSGELLVRGPQVMMGYLNNEKATAETIDEEGYLHTGDVAYYDEDHFFYIVDRCKELIKVKGNQVSPTELENLIMEIPGVSDVGVVGIPDTLAGEIPKAYVVIKEGSNLTEEDVLRYVNSKVAHYKKLAGGVKFIDSIPRNVSGKILRNELKIIK